MAHKHLIRRALMLCLMILLLLAGIWPGPVLAQGDLIAQNVSNLNVRTGPDTGYPLVGTVPRGSDLVVEGRNHNGSWLLVRTTDGAVRGWAASRYIFWDGELGLGDLPVAAVESTGGPGRDSPAPLPVENASDPAAYMAALEAELANVPLISGISEHTRQIVANGRGFGTRPNVIAKVGDCNTESLAFLAPLDSGNYALGPYGDLEATIAYFAGSFSRESVAGRAGFNTLSALDALWADGQQCEPGESPVWCEYRHTRAGVALIMFGANDIHLMSGERFEQALRRIVDFTLRRGAVPVLSTFTATPAAGSWIEALEFNLVTVNVARAYNIPLVNFWRVARDLPNYGLAGDNLHLSYSGTPTVAFNGEEALYGFSARNLLTLQALDEIRRVVFAG